ncbi:MAG: amidohydrolase family protein [Trueperaceae bacterium]
MSDHQDPAERPKRSVILADRLIDGNGGPAIEEPAIVVEGDRIVRVTTSKQWEEAPEDVDEVRTHPGSTVLPGMIDGHVHLVLSAGVTSEEVLAEYMESDDLRLAAMATENARRCLAGGITTVRDCGGPGTMIQALRDAIAAGVTRGPRVLATGMPITTTGGHCNFFGLRADDAGEIRKAVRQLVEDDVDWLKVMSTGGRMTRNSNILRAQYSAEELGVLVAEGRRLKRRVASHALNIEGIRNSVEAGVDTLEHCNWQDDSGQWDFDEALLAKIAEQGTHVSITIVGYMRDAYRAWKADPDGAPLTPFLRRRFALEGEMFARGLNAFITSDAGVPGSHFSELHQSVAVAVAWLGLEPSSAIAAVTSRAARALGVEDRVGSVEAGKLADLMVVRGNPMEDIDALGGLEATYLGGERVAFDGAVLPADPRTIGPRPATFRRSGGWVP